MSYEAEKARVNVMPLVDAVAHLRGRVHVQKTQKTCWNRLRWTKKDIAACEAILTRLEMALERQRLAS